MKYVHILLMSMLIILCVNGATLAQSGPNPTPQWIFFYSLGLELDGDPVDSGTVVQAFVSRTGQQCGEQTVTSSGALPLLTCYMTDLVSSTDGVVGGDVIYFVVNGVRAAETYQLPTTIFNGQRFELKQLTTASTSFASCVDGYEPDDNRSVASELTGPEAHTFFSEKRGWDQDWSKFYARGNWTYQIKARSFQPLSITHPVLRLYDADGNLLAENTMDKWGRGAEIWWWNEGGNQEMYVQVVEAEGQYGCRHYTLTLFPWSPDEMRLRFDQ